jgi:hypothetical protein
MKTSEFSTTERIVGKLMRLNSLFLVKYEKVYEYPDNTYFVINLFNEGDLSKAIEEHKKRKIKFPNEVSFFYFLSFFLGM